MGDAQTTAGLPRRCAPRNDKRWGVAGEVGSVLLFGCVPQRCHCEPGRAWQSGLLTFMSLRGRSRRELTWQSSLRRYMGCRTRSAGLPRRGAPRNDKREDGNGRGDARPGFSDASHNAVIASPAGRGNQVSSLFVIARKVSKRTDVAIQSEALCGRPGRCGGCPTRPLDCRVRLTPSSQ
jgi:hypothetical protein